MYGSFSSGVNYSRPEDVLYLRIMILSPVGRANATFVDIYYGIK